MGTVVKKRRKVGLDDVSLAGDRHGMGPPAGLELVENMVDVVFYGSGLITSSRAVCSLERPSAMRRRTSSSRADDEPETQPCCAG